jgi:hypothetical protein
MFGLDPHSIASRAQAASTTSLAPTLSQSILRGMLGFTLVSLGGFGPWILAGRWFYRHTGEVGLYAACALVFVGLNGPLLHRLIIPPGSLVRCYKIFALAFAGYALVWTLSWMLLRGVIGGVVGALAGMAVMGGLLAWGFAAPAATLKVVAALFLTNLAGYFIGDWAHTAVQSVFGARGFGMMPSSVGLISRSVWGLCYGLGFGAGIGIAFYLCQAEARRLFKSSPGSFTNQAQTPSTTTTAPKA